jgi:Asp-tRNA(Asn)/Glu-tRNA(Gln) amidotransferase B subunit
VSDPTALSPIVDQVIDSNPGKADEYRAGKTGLLGFFVGQVMRLSGGKANPALVTQLVQERLEG